MRNASDKADSSASKRKPISRWVPIIVACPIFLQNVGLSATAVALPSMADSFGVPILQLSVLVATYAISLAAFLPLSVWMADRFGAKLTFCAAIALFALASALCGFARSVDALIAFRVLQGLGGAMMVPVGRLILLRAVPATELVSATIWFTIPPAVGRLLGPLVGGAMVTVADWRWIFFLNIPLGLIVLVIAGLLIHTEEPVARVVRPRFDVFGFVLMAFGLGALLGGLETIGKGLFLEVVPLGLILSGVILLATYGWYSLQQPHPLIDLGVLKHAAFRGNVVGAAPFRLANSGVSFLIPIMLQIGFSLPALTAGFVAAASALGSLGTRAILNRAMQLVTFRHLLIGSAGLASLIFAFHGMLRPGTPIAMTFGVVFLGGLVSSMCMVALNTLGFVEMPAARVSHATALLAMTQQVTSALGIVLAAGLLRFAGGLHVVTGPAMELQDFGVGFLVLSLIGAISLLFFARLP